MAFYVLETAQKWGDAGALLIRGSGFRETRNSPLFLQRTGPFVPSLSQNAGLLVVAPRRVPLLACPAVPLSVRMNLTFDGQIWTVERLQMTLSGNWRPNSSHHCCASQQWHTDVSDVYRGHTLRRAGWHWRSLWAVSEDIRPHGCGLTFHVEHFRTKALASGSRRRNVPLFLQSCRNIQELEYHGSS